MMDRSMRVIYSLYSVVCSKVETYVLKAGTGGQPPKEVGPGADRFTRVEPDWAGMTSYINI